jgi:hypothetical protein
VIAWIFWPRLPGTKIVDLSADFRLADPAAYARRFGHEHAQPDLDREAVYGLVERYRRDNRTPARLVADPGCYTTGSQLPLLPLLDARAIDPDAIIIDAKSGVTGAAGRSAAGGRPVHRGERGLPCLRRGQAPAHGGARPGVLQGSRARGGGDLHAASAADQPRYPPSTSSC